MYFSIALTYIRKQSTHGFIYLLFPLPKVSSEKQDPHDLIHLYIFLAEDSAQHTVGAQ